MITLFLAFNLFQPGVAFDIETIRLIGTANQMTGFFMKCNTGMIILIYVWLTFDMGCACISLRNFPSVMELFYESR